MGAVVSTNAFDTNGDEIFVNRVCVIQPDGTRVDSRINYFNNGTAAISPDITFTNDSNINKSWTIPSGREVTPLLIYVQLTTGITTATRTVAITYENAAGLVFAEFNASTTQLLSLTRTYTFAEALTHKIISIPLSSGSKIKVTVQNGTASDNISIARLTVRERLLF